MLFFGGGTWAAADTALVEQRVDVIPLCEGIDELITPPVLDEGDQTTDE